MSQVRDRLKEHPSLRMATMVLGLSISAVGVNGFLRQAHLLSGGVTGLATVINYLTGVNVGLMTFLIKVGIFDLNITLHLDNSTKYISTSCRCPSPKDKSYT